MNGTKIFGIMISSMWVSAAIGSIFTNNAHPFDHALLASVLFGIGYFLVKMITF